jgi:hypothetical protein
MNDFMIDVDRRTKYLQGIVEAIDRHDNTSAETTGACQNHLHAGEF